MQRYLRWCSTVKLIKRSNGTVVMRALGSNKDINEMLSIAVVRRIVQLIDRKSEFFCAIA